MVNLGIHLFVTSYAQVGHFVIHSLFMPIQIMQIPCFWPLPAPFSAIEQHIFELSDLVL